MGIVRGRRLVITLCSLSTLGVLLFGCSSTATVSTSEPGTQTVTSVPSSAQQSENADSTGAAAYPADAVHAQSGGSQAEEGQTYAAGQDDQSAILVTDHGSLAVTRAVIQSRGETSSKDSSNLYGLNAAVVATSGSRIDLSDSTITTTGSGANGAFTTGAGSQVTLSEVIIETIGEAAHGVMAAQDGSVTLDNTDIRTVGADSAPLASGLGGTIIANGSKALATGRDSPALYSTGTITINGGAYEATGAEAAIVEGAGSIILTSANLRSSVSDRWGVMIYNSMSRDPLGVGGTFSMTGGSLVHVGKTGPLFYVTNATGTINLEGVDVTSASGVLVRAAAGDRGSSESNGGIVVLTAKGQALVGNLVADRLSAITVTLRDFSSLTGGINSNRTAGQVNLVMDSTSIWNVTMDSFLSSLSFPEEVDGAAFPNIVGNGHTVYYDAANPANSVLEGKTFDLIGGGTLQPLT